MDRDKEKILVERAKYDKEAFGILFNEYFSLILNYVFRRIGDRGDAEEITQEVFLKALSSISTYKDRGIPYSSYLMRIAINEVNDYVKKKRKIILMGDMRNVFKDYSSDDKKRKFLIIQRLLLKLPLKYQTVISLKYFEKLKIKEIAEVLNKNENTVKTLLRRGIKKLKEEIEKDETFSKEFGLNE